MNRKQWFEETLRLKDINKNNGLINCAHCALRLDTYIAQGGTNGRVRPVPIGDAKLITHPTFDGKKLNVHLQMTKEYWIEQNCLL